MISPYHDLPPEAFWRSGIVGAAGPLAAALWHGPPLARGTRILTLGDAFAGAVHRGLAAAEHTVLDCEPPPPGMTADALVAGGWCQGSARTGPLRNPREVAQLLMEVAGRKPPRPAIRQTGPDCHHDCLRPTVDRAGFATSEDAEDARADHLARLSDGLANTDVMLLCLSGDSGIEDRKTRAAHPPEAAALCPDLRPYRSSSAALLQELLSIWRDLRTLSPAARLLLAVSPTAEGGWPARAAGSAALRVAMERTAARSPRISYLPAFEMLTAPGQSGLISAEGQPTEAGIAALMALMFDAGGPERPTGRTADTDRILSGTNAGSPAKEE